MPARKSERIYLSAMQMAAHEFHATARRMGELGYSDRELLERLHDQRRAALKTMSGLLFSALLIFFATPEGDALTAFSVQTPYFSISLPKMILVFMSGVLWMFAWLHWISLEMLNLYILAVVRRKLKGVPWHMAERFFEGDGAWFDPINVSWRFFRSGTFQVILVAITLLTICIPVVLLGSLMFFESVRFSANQIELSVLFSLNVILAILTISSFFFPILLRILLIVPFPFERNVGYVRWNFLYRISRSMNREHPQARNWR